MKEMIAYCGLDCEKCDAYVATVTNDDALRKKTAKFWSELNGIEITPDQINCEGCRRGGVKTIYCDKLCPIRLCALEKSYETCGNCAEIDSCPKVAMIISDNPTARDNLKK